MKRLLLGAFLLFAGGLVRAAETTKTTFNPFTGRHDFITEVSTQNFVPGTGIGVTCTNGVCTITAAGSAASTLGISKGGVQFSSPTAGIDVTGEGVAVGVGAGNVANLVWVSTTAFTTKNQTWTVQQTFNSSMTVLAPLGLASGVIFSSHVRTLFHSHNSSNTFSGPLAGQSNTSGTANTYLGMNSGFSNTDGVANTYGGWNSGMSGTSSNNRNTLFGGTSGRDMSTGANDNTCIGHGSCLLLGGTDQNTAIGRAAGGNTVSTLTGNDNFSGGFEAGAGLTSGARNTFVGTESGEASTTGTDNVFVGRRAGDTNATGSNNFAIGSGADFVATDLNNAGVIGANATVSSSDTLQISESLHVRGSTMTFFRMNVTTATVSNDLLVAGKKVCLADGTNCIPGGGGGSGTLAIYLGGVQISSPTPIIAVDTNTMTAFQVNSSTTMIAVNQHLNISTLTLRNFPTNVPLYVDAAGNLNARAIDLESSDVTGVLAADRGGTGHSLYDDGILLIGNGDTGQLSTGTITAGSNVTVTNGPGTITISASAGAGVVQLPLPGGATNYIQNTDALQSGATTYLSSATVRGEFYVGQSTTVPGQIIMRPGTGLSYGTNSPSSIFHLVADSSIDPSPFFKITGNMNLLNIANSGDSAAATFSNSNTGSSAYGFQVQKLVPGAAAGLFSSFQTTAAFVSATNGTGLFVAATPDSDAINISGGRFYAPTSSGTLFQISLASMSVTESMLVTGKKVCLADGTNCTAGAGGGGYALEPATVTIQANKGISASTMVVTSSGTFTLLAPTAANFFQLSMQDNLVKFRYFQNGVNDNYFTWATTGTVMPTAMYIGGGNTMTSEGALRSRASGAGGGLTDAGLVNLWSTGGKGNFVSFNEAGVSNNGTLGFAAGSTDLVFKSGAEDITGGVEQMRASPTTGFSVSTATVFRVTGSTGVFSNDVIVGGSQVCREDGTNCPAGGAGDITDVLAGFGLTGGGVSGSVTLAVGTTVAFENEANTFSSSQTVTGVGGLAVQFGAILGSATVNDLTASQIVVTDANKKLASQAVLYSTHTVQMKCTSLDKLETTNFMVNTSTASGLSNYITCSADNVTRQYVNGFFKVPDNLNSAGTITVRTYGRSSTAAATKAVGWYLEHQPLANGEQNSTTYLVSASSGLAVSATQGINDSLAWNMSVSSSTWEANDIVNFRFGRDVGVTNNLASPYYLNFITIEIPVTAKP